MKPGHPAGAEAETGSAPAVRWLREVSVAVRVGTMPVKETGKVVCPVASAVAVRKGPAVRDLSNRGAGACVGFKVEGVRERSRKSR